MSINVDRNDPLRTEKQAIVMIVERWKRLWPEEARLFDEGQKETRAGLHNEQGTDAAKTMTYQVRIPRRVLEAIDLMFEAEGIRLENNQDLWKWFRESFPEFVIGKPRSSRGFRV